MNAIAALNVATTVWRGAPPPTVAGAGVTRAPVWPRDRVDLRGLTVGDALERISEPRIQELRRQIAAGTYLTDEKLNVVTERLCGLLARARRVNAPLAG